MKTRLMVALATLLAASALAQQATRDWQDPTTSMTFVHIEKGCYQMGTKNPIMPHPDPFWNRIGYDRSLSDDEVPQHEACVDAFWLGKYEVRAQEWAALMGGPGGEHPVANVSWGQARAFAAKLSQRSGVSFRLPTEAEWEYACRAGTAVEQVAVSKELFGQAWYSRGDARRAEPQKVGQLAANAFGLHDMLGNVWEWTEDSYLPDGYRRHGLYNPTIHETTGQKVIRGGSIRSEPRQTRCAVRGHIDPAQALDSVGFRLVRTR